VTGNVVVDAGGHIDDRILRLLVGPGCEMSPDLLIAVVQRHSANIVELVLGCYGEITNQVMTEAMLMAAKHNAAHGVSVMKLLLDRGVHHRRRAHGRGAQRYYWEQADKSASQHRQRC